MLPQRNTLILRLILIVVLALTFVWMSFEDTDTTFVLLLSANVTIAAAVLWLFRTYGGVPVPFGQFVLGGALLGAVSGAGIAVLAAFLMFFKNAWHAHLFPDFPLPMIGGMAARAFAWGIAGALFGLALALFALAAAAAKYQPQNGDGA